MGVAGAANLRPNIEERQLAADAFAAKLAGLIQGFKAAGMTQRAMVSQLNVLDIKSVRGGKWSLVQLERLMVRLGAERDRKL